MKLTGQRGKSSQWAVRRWSGMDSQRDAFSHSPQCDKYFSESAMESVDSEIFQERERFRLLPGGEVAHTECNCWCHQHAIDKNEPPEYVIIEVPGEDPALYRMTTISDGQPDYASINGGPVFEYKKP